jgi:diacylglycerol kinase family enzyme
MRRVAILLNPNAQRVTTNVIAQFQRLHDPDDVFVTSSLAEVRAAIRTIVAREYDVLCTGGGDGTFVKAVNELCAVPAGRALIFYGLRLGSGNAIADVCGAARPTAKGIAADLARAASDEPPGALRLLMANDRLAHFAGAGLDAKFNEDFAAVIKRGLGQTRLGHLFHGVPGIVIAAAGRTLPRLICEPHPRVRIVAVAGPAHRLDHAGHACGEPLLPGAVLFEGRATISSASVVTTFGRGLRFFPFADALQPDRFQLRVSTNGALQSLRYLPRVFAGSPRIPDGLQDFAVSGVRVELIDPCPTQIGGDLCDPVDAVTVTFSPHHIRLLRARHGAGSWQSPPCITGQRARGTP